MATKQGLMRAMARFEWAEPCVRRETPRWLHAIQGGGGETTLAELIADPVAEAVMRADGVHPAEIVALFEIVRRRRGAL